MTAPAVAIARGDDWFDGPSDLVVDHPRFGTMRASLRSAGQPWLWECLDLVQTARGAADLAFHAGPEGPRVAHERQLAGLIARLELLTQAAARLISNEVIGSRWTELEWQGARLTGRAGAFDLGFWCRCNDDDLLIVVRFERSVPVAAWVDD